MICVCMCLCRVQETEDLQEMDKSVLETIAGDIEDNLFAIHKDVNHRYKARYRSLLFNLKDEKNNVLFRRVVSRTISTAQLVVMTHEELASDELSKWREDELKKVCTVYTLRTVCAVCTVCTVSTVCTECTVCTVCTVLCVSSVHMYIHTYVHNMCYMYPIPNVIKVMQPYFPKCRHT